MWQHGWKDGIPDFIKDAEFEVYQKDGQFRFCKRNFKLDYSNLFYTDNNGNFYANAYCHGPNIVRWRIKPNSP